MTTLTKVSAKNQNMTSTAMRVTAIEEAREISLKIDGPVYLFAVMEGGYFIANEKREYSNEKLIFTFLNGETL